MNDRELLEMAARANNDPKIYKDIGEFYRIIGRNEDMGCDVLTIWNPLNNDGDALRLAVTLGMEVYIDDHPDGCDCVEAESYTHKSGRFLISLSAGNDKYAAVRKVIVMVAAEIGRQMKTSGG